MNNGVFYNTISTSASGMTLNPERRDERPKTPPGLIVTTAVETKDGWLAQIIVDRAIVFEKLLDWGDADDAIEEANSRVVRAFRDLFSEPAGA